MTLGMNVIQLEATSSLHFQHSTISNTNIEAVANFRDGNDTSALP